MRILKLKRKRWRFPEDLKKVKNIAIFMPENGTSVFLLPYLLQNSKKNITLIFKDELLPNFLKIKNSFSIIDHKIKEIIKKQEIVIDASIEPYPKKFLKKSHFIIKLGENLHKGINYNFIYFLKAPVLSEKVYKNFFSFFKINPTKLPRNLIKQKLLPKENITVSYGIKNDNPAIVDLSTIESEAEKLNYIIKAKEYKGILSLFFEIAYLLNKDVSLKLKEKPPYIDENIKIL